jgi:Zn-dependent metalloprotease
MKKLGMAVVLAGLTSAAFAENGTIKIYDAKASTGIISILTQAKERLVMEDGRKVKLLVPKDAHHAHENIKKTRDFFQLKFDLNSYDNKGADIIAWVNVNRWAPLDLSGLKQNAAWAKTHFIFGAGTDKGIDNMVKALDVVGHEYTHAVIDHTSKLKYEGQSGALNEHFADVFGALINMHYQNPAKPFLIGSTILNGKYAEKAEALRDMANPEKSLSPQPFHMKHLELEQLKVFGEGCKPTNDNDKCGVHVLSGIPNKMATIVMSKLHINDSANLFYNVMTKRLKPDAKFVDYKIAMMQECKTMASDVCAIVSNAFKAVGL